MNTKSILAFDIDGTLTKRNQYQILPDGLGIIEGLYWLTKKNFFQSDSNFIRDLIHKLPGVCYDKLCT